MAIANAEGMDRKVGNEAYKQDAFDATLRSLPAYGMCQSSPERSFVSAVPCTSSTCIENGRSQWQPGSTILAALAHRSPGDWGGLMVANISDCPRLPSLYARSSAAILGAELSPLLQLSLVHCFCRCDLHAACFVKP